MEYESFDEVDSTDEYDATMEAREYVDGALDGWAGDGTAQEIRDHVQHGEYGEALEEYQDAVLDGYIDRIPEPALAAAEAVTEYASNAWDTVQEAGEWATDQISENVDSVVDEVQAAAEHVGEVAAEYGTHEYGETSCGEQTYGETSYGETSYGEGSYGEGSYGEQTY